jgi:septal ring factor EnvC (AmiA/AmiB activator)
MNNNNLINASIEKINESKMESAVAKQIQLIKQLEATQASIKELEGAIANERKALTELAARALTPESVLGTPAPVNPNANEVAMIKAIAEMNKARSASVEVETKNRATRIDAYQAQIDQSQKTIANLRKDIAGVVVEATTVDKIVG